MKYSFACLLLSVLTGAKAFIPQTSTTRTSPLFAEVGNYGNKRVVGSVVGKEKRVSVQRYNPLAGTFEQAPGMESPVDAKVGNYGDKRLVGNVMGRRERVAAEPQVDAQPKVGKVGNYGDKRLVGNVVGKRERAFTHPHEERVAPASKREVGNYGNRRLVGNVVGTQKRVSVQRYSH